jgi:nucleoside permease NupC
MAKLNWSELFLVMTTGMAIIAGTFLVLYSSFLTGVIADPAGYLTYSVFD